MTKRTIISLLIAALVALLLPWFAVTFVKGDNGMAVCFLMFFAVNPVTAILLGIFSGGDVRAAWFQPLLFAALFLLGTWVFFTMAEMAFVLYAAAYLIWVMPPCCWRGVPQSGSAPSNNDRTIGERCVGAG